MQEKKAARTFAKKALQCRGMARKKEGETFTGAARCE
jgi:hypothetical protein